MNKAESAILERYSRAALEIVDLLRQVFENPGLEMDKKKEISFFYDGDWNVDDLVRECLLWFAICQQVGMEPTVKNPQHKLVE